MTRFEHTLSVIADDDGLTLEEFSRACAVERDWVVARVREGLLVAPGADPAVWRFGSVALRRARAMRRVERDFDAVPELAALVADLVEEIESLRRRLR